MTAVSIKQMLDTHVAENTKRWAHDRSSTVGASEVGQCARRVYFNKVGTTADDDYVDSYGAKLRGDIIENYHWLPALRSQLPDSAQLLFAGDDQKTLVDGYLSATSDGLLVGVSRDCLSHHGEIDISADSLVAECKSLDPRISLHDAKAEHRFQVQAQLGLIRHCTKYQPEYALISYIDASWLDDVSEYPVKFDPAIYAVAKQRAMDIMSANAAIDLPPEGKMAGGKECRYCPFQNKCAGATVGAIPTDTQPISAADMAVLKELVIKEQTNKETKITAAQKHADSQEEVKEFLREHKTRKVQGDGFSVAYYPVRGRKPDSRAAECLTVKSLKIET